jgi:hypothetical protein
VTSLTYESKSVAEWFEYTTKCKKLKYMHILHVSLLSNQLTLHNKITKLVFDLSNQKQLQILKLYYCKNVEISDLHTKQLEQLHINDCARILDFDCLLNASKLAELNIKDYTGNLISLPLVLQRAPLRELTLCNVKCSQSKRHGIDL